MRLIRLLDLFSGAGGAAMGYHQAVFEVMGVDIVPQPHYPFTFVQVDALKYLTDHGHEFDVIHASPPCQGYSRMHNLPWLRGKMYPLMLPEVLGALKNTRRYWVVENVEDAPLDGVVLCGFSMGLPLYRHRRFASNILLMAPAHKQHQQSILGGRQLNKRYAHSGGIAGVLPIVTVAGHTSGLMRFAPKAMGIDWMTRDELTQAIPPVYTEWIGKQLLIALERQHAYV